MLKILKGGKQIEFTHFLFPGGEVGVRLTEESFILRGIKAPYQTIVARINDSNDVMRLVMLTDALRRIDSTPIRLFMPYTPYARQDRACNPGESFSLKAFANLINGLTYEKVTVVDPHSDVVAAVFDRLEVFTQFDVINRFDAFIRAVKPGALFVAPDAGANKKTSVLANYFGHTEFIRADKLRDLTNGNIKETIVYAEDLSGKTVIIADDIGDGMRTFIELAKVLKAKGAAKVILYITHGIYSKGASVLYEGGIDEVYTTNSYREDMATVDPKAIILDLDDIFVNRQ